MRREAATVIFLLALSFILLNFIRPGGVLAYLIPPILWVLMFLVAYPHVRNGPAASSTLLVLVLIVSSLKIAVYTVSGLFSGFGVSPYVLTPWGVFINLVYVITRILGLEFSRALLVTRFRVYERPIVAILLLPLAYTILQANLYELAYAQGMLDALITVSSSFMPLFAENIFLTQVVILGGPLYTSLYMLTFSMFQYLSPVLPNLHWSIKSIISVGVPLIGYVLVSSSRVVTSTSRSHREKPNLRYLAYVLMLVVLVLATGGVFGYKPAVIVSGSMRPTIEVGDLVIAKHVSESQISNGDIIVFRSPKGLITHRVEAIIRSEDKVEYITKGDANRDPDADLVDYRNVVGKVIIVVPKAGWPSIFLGSLIAEVVSSAGSVLERFSGVYFLSFPLSILPFYILRGTRLTKGVTNLKKRFKIKPNLKKTGIKIDVVKTVTLALLAVMAFSAFTSIVLYSMPPEVERTSYSYRFEHVIEYDYKLGLYPNVLYGNASYLKNVDREYIKLVKNVDVTLNYKVKTGKPYVLDGEYESEVVLEEPEGWSKTIYSSGVIPFGGSSFSHTNSINMTVIKEFIDEIRKETGTRSSQYTVTIKSTLNTRVDIGGHLVEDTLHPTFTITVDFQSGLLKFTHTNSTYERSDLKRWTEPVKLPVLGYNVNVSDLKIASYTILASSIIALIPAWIALGKSRHERKEHEEIESRYGDIIVNVKHIDTNAPDAVEVASMEDLSKVSSSAGRPILHAVDNVEGKEKHVYAVHDGSKLYMYYTE